MAFRRGLKESGYESDSTLVFKRREDASLQLSPKEQKEVYKSIQKGGDVPLQGLRKPAPERPKGLLMKIERALEEQQKCSISCSIA